ncbi:hypothetical protein HID58_036279, partial [Brassica napus]
AVASRLRRGEENCSLGFDSGRWRLPQLRRRRPLFPGGGSFFSFAFPGGEGYNSFASPALSISWRFLVFGFRIWCVVERWPSRMRFRRSDEALRRVDRFEEQRWFRRRLCGF